MNITSTIILTPLLLLACYVLAVTIIENIKDLYKGLKTPKPKQRKPRKKQARDARGRYTNKPPEKKEKHNIIVNHNGEFSHTITL